MAASNCSCSPSSPNGHVFDDNVSTPNQDVPILKHFTSTLLFEPTVVGTTVTKTFRIKNESKKTQTYVIQRDPNTNPIYHVFDFKMSRTKVSAGQYLECTVTYSPKVPHERNVDCFQIVDNHFKLYKICLQGECIGPSVNVSISMLFFFFTKNRHRLTNTFELQNTSNVPVTFQFEMNEKEKDQEIFKLNKTKGTIEPFKDVYISVTFDVNVIGLYAKHLVCKILHHAPIMIELVGAYTALLDFNLDDILLKKYSLRADQLYGFSGYMFDSIKTTVHKPPFSLSVNYLDFGRLDFQKNSNNSRTLVTSFTNHLEQRLEIFWQNCNDRVFKITPKEVVVPAGETVLFECQFTPHFPDRMYTNHLVACVYWTVFRTTLKEVAFVKVIDVPLNLHLTILGHTFPENKEWLPRVEVLPDVIILPPSMPMSTTYTTFMLKSSGHLPTSFKFIPPKKTNFIIKPMVGLIYDFQIIVAQLQPDMSDKKAYVELWGLELNGRVNNNFPFYLKGYSEYAYITVGINNTVTFNTVYPGCQDILDVTIKNNSTHFVRYNFVLGEKSYFSINHPQGYLASNETAIVQWYYTGHLEAPEVTVVKCEVQTVQKIKLITGTPLDTFVTLHTKCIFSQLCATPNSWDFEEMPWGSTGSTFFHLFNFGDSPIHFKLVSKCKPEIAEQLNIVPTQGTVNPKENIRIILHIKALIVQQQEIQIMYHIRLNAVSSTVIGDGRCYNIFLVRFFCLYPTLKIEDITSNNFGFLFSKVTLWGMFKIDEINKALAETKHDESRDVEICIPDYEMGEADFFATFVLRNTTQFSEKIKLQRHQLCGCKLIAKPKGLSLREKIYDCVHRHMFKMTITEEVIEPQQSQKLKMEVKYLEHGLTHIMYSMILSNNRNINLYVNINVLPEIVTRASSYFLNFEMKLQNVFIGEKEPPAQVFPLYNNSAFTINYELDTAPLKRLNFNYGFNIFNCLNPKGIIQPFATIQIFFSFIPIEARNYEISIPLKMDENEIQLKLSGKGTLSYSSYVPNNGTVVSGLPNLSYIENAIELSVDQIILEPMPVWSTVEKLMFIKNQTSDRIFGYAWQSCIVEGIIKAEVIYRKGILQPKESHAIIIQINSFDQPCRLCLQIACKLLDYTQHIHHQQSFIAYNLKQQEMEGQFTITEKGITRPTNDVVILPKAEPFFITLAIHLCIISIPDKDICMSYQQHLEQSPQYSLHVNMGQIFARYFKTIIPKKSQLHLPTLKDMDRIGDQKNPKAQLHCCSTDLDKSNVKIFKQVVECLIADAVLNDFFHKITNTISSSSQPYYVQFKAEDNCDVHQSTYKETEEKLKQNLERRMELVENFLNKPQSPFLAHVLKELIADGIHEVFQLGPQIKKQVHRPYVYYTVKSKFT